MYDEIRQALFLPRWIQRFRRTETAFTHTHDRLVRRLVSVLLNLRTGGTELELKGFFLTLEEQPLALATPTVCGVRQPANVSRPRCFPP